jgi:hypothetical protein
VKVRVRTLMMGAVVATAACGLAAYSPAPTVTVERIDVDPEVGRAAAVLLALLAPRPEVAVEVPLPVDDDLGAAVAAEALRQLRHPDLRYRDDCSGFVSAVFSAVGVPMDGRVVTLWDQAVELDVLHWDPVPRPGDVIFFDDTYDRDRDGLVDDDFTHIGLVVDVEDDGTVVFAHAGLSQGRALGRMNVLHPDEARGPNGERWNSSLRNRRPGDRPGTVYLTGQLWAAFARVPWSTDWRVGDGA